MKQLLVYCLVFFLSSAAAQTLTCRDRECTVNAVGNYLIELAGCHSRIDLYVYNREMEPLRHVELGGMARFNYHESVIDRNFRQYYTTNQISAPVPFPGFSSCEVILFIGNERVVTHFDNECHGENLSGGVLPGFLLRTATEAPSGVHVD